MGEKFVGKWENVESVGMEGFLKAIGQEEMIKMLAKESEQMPKGTVEIEVGNDGKHWKFIAEKPTIKGKHVIEFDVGVENERTAGGVKTRSIASFDGKKLVEKQLKIKPEDKVCQIEWEIADGKLVITTTPEGHPEAKSVHKLKRTATV